MAVSSAVTFQLLELLLVACEYLLFNIGVNSNIVDTQSRFAFVEYESRRDADDAYHEMHNKRIGRDDLLKIEVYQHWYSMSGLSMLIICSGLVHLPRLLGASILAVRVNALVNVLLAVVLLAVVVAPHLQDAAVVVTSLLARMIDVTEITIAETATAPAAQTIG